MRGINHKTKENLDPTEAKNVVRPSSLKAQQKRWTSWQLMMHLSHEKWEEKLGTKA